MKTTLEDELRCACQLLETATPEAMDASAGVLESVARDLGIRRAHIGAAEARRLRALMQQARMLLELAARFHARWRDIVATSSGGYTALGSPAELTTRARTLASA
jgi:hypothetical protein